MKISVIIPTYKPQAYLWECLDSLKKQTLPKQMFEIIIVLNGYCKPYEELISKYIDENLEDFHITFIKTERPGVSNARNIAMDSAKGEYITFIDDDDCVSECYLSELLQNSSPDTIAICYPVSFEDSSGDIDDEYYLTKEYNNYSNLGCVEYYRVRRFFAGPCMKLIHRDIIAHRRFDEKYSNGEDTLFMFLISDKMSMVKFASTDAIYFRRIRNNSATTRTRSIFDRLNNSMRLCFDYCKIYINGSGYSLNFWITRVLGSLKSIFIK